MKQNAAPMKLTEEQQQVIQQVQGPQLVLAAVGTGKTLVMAERARNAIETGVVDPTKILCLTFTNRAAEEMRQRIATHSTPYFTHITISTIHALCAKMLRTTKTELGLPQQFLIIDEEEALQVFQEAAHTLYHRGIYRLGWENIPYLFSTFLYQKANVPAEDLELILIPNRLINHPSRSLTPYLSLGHQQELINEYHRRLRSAFLLDFGDLIYYVRALLHLSPPFRAYWEQFFGWIQVDELQDITVAEFDILRLLASSHRNLALFGDLDQTIYQWRGSQPFVVLEQFAQHFPDYQQFRLTQNFRSTQHIIAFADAFAQSFRDRRTQLQAAAHLPQGTAVTIQEFSTAELEARWIGSMIHRLQTAYSGISIAILTRTNAQAEFLGQQLESQGIPVVVATRRSTMRSPALKYLAAILRLLLNPQDTIAASTIFAAHAAHNEAIQQALADLVQSKFFARQLSDALNPAIIQTPNQYQQFLAALQQQRVCIIDAETTGLHLPQAEVVQIAVLHLNSMSKVINQFHRYVQPTGTVGLSSAVHQLSDEFLARYGHDKEKVLLQLLALLPTKPFFVGYNVAFDLVILRKELETHKVNTISFDYLDLFPVLQRQYELDRYDLNFVANHFHFSVSATHSAIADARVTHQLLQHLLPSIQTLARCSLVDQLPLSARTLCEEAAEILSTWREISFTYPLTKIVQQVFETTEFPGAKSLFDSSQISPAYEYAHHWDQQQSDTVLRLSKFLAAIALERPIDQHRYQGAVLITTLHQSKGLEFDVVFLPGANDAEYPKLFESESTNKEKLEEEKRLFYVGLTRAKKRLFLSWSHKDFREVSVQISPFVQWIQQTLQRQSRSFDDTP